MAREAANTVLERLRDRSLNESGSIAVEQIDILISTDLLSRAFRASPWP